MLVSWPLLWLMAWRVLGMWCSFPCSLFRETPARSERPVRHRDLGGLYLWELLDWLFAKALLPRNHRQVKLFAHCAEFFACFLILYPLLGRVGGALWQVWLLCGFDFQAFFSFLLNFALHHTSLFSVFVFRGVSLILSFLVGQRLSQAHARIKLHAQSLKQSL